MEALAKNTLPRFEAARVERQSQLRLLERLGSELDARIPGIASHCQRVSRLAAGIAREMGLAPAGVARIRQAAAVHDIGKLEMPAEIVNKRGPLSAEEFALVKQHSLAGAEIVAGLGDPELTAIVRHHHERFDGDGYPDGLAGVEIPLGARIVAVADTYDAVTSARPYRDAVNHREALALLAAEAGTQLDPNAVAAFRAHQAGPLAFLQRALAR